MDYSQFTNLYSLTKTLKFELKPTEDTRKLLEKHSIINKDKKIDELYHSEMKPIFDDLHKKYIKESLLNLNLEVETLQEFLDLYQEKKTK